MEWRYRTQRRRVRQPNPEPNPALLAIVIVQLLWGLTDKLLCGCLHRQGVNAAARALTPTSFVYMQHS
jgi:hypothetical protein